MVLGFGSSRRVELTPLLFFHATQGFHISLFSCWTSREAGPQKQTSLPRSLTDQPWRTVVDHRRSEHLRYRCLRGALTATLILG